MIKAIKTNDKTLRVIYGPLAEDLDIDWTQGLDDMKGIIEFLLSNHYGQSLPSFKKAKFKNIKVYTGSSHLDIVDDGVGSLGLLRVEDNFYEHNKN